MNLAIIGAGMAGLTAARTLRARRPDITITLYEKSRGLGGRVATRRVAGYAFDHGAQYMKAPTAALEQLITSELSGKKPVDILSPVWTFDGAGQVREGDPQQNTEHKWTWSEGLNTLGKQLAEDLTIVRETRVARLEAQASGSGYRLLADDGTLIDEADMILLTAPAPQTAEILAYSSLDAGLKDALVAELAKATYRRCLSLTFAYDHQPNVPWYALVNTDRQHPVSWLACEHAKPGRVTDGTGLMTAQMAPQFSVEHYDQAQAGTFEPITTGPTYVREVHKHVLALTGADLGEPRWGNLQRWRYALPDGRADFDTLNGTSSGLFFAGDYTAGQGRVHLAIEAGWKIAEVIRDASQ